MSLLRSPWVSGGLAVAALGFVAYQVLSSGRSRGRSAPVAAAVAPAAAQPSPTAAPPKTAPPPSVSSSQNVATAQIPIDRLFVQSRFADWLESPRRDPFLNLTARPALVGISPIADWKLSAIWHQTGSRIATINGGIYQEGDEIQGHKIERIDVDKVWIRGPTGSEPLGFVNRLSETNTVPTNTNAASGAEPTDRRARGDSLPVSTNRPYRKLPLIED